MRPLLRLGALGLAVEGAAAARPSGLPPELEGGSVRLLAACADGQLGQRLLELADAPGAGGPPADGRAAVAGVSGKLGGLDASAPAQLAIAEMPDGQERLWLSVGLQDPAAAQAALGELGLPWGADSTLRVEGSRLVVATPFAGRASPSPAAGSLAVGLHGLHPAPGGCQVVVDISGADPRLAGPTSLWVDVGAGGEHVGLEVVGDSVQPYVALLDGPAGVSAPRGRGSEPPVLVVRLNLDPEELLRGLEDLPPPVGGRGEEVDGVLVELRKARINLGSGAEFAVMGQPGARVMAAVVPVRRPWNARRILGRLERYAEREGMTWREQGELLVLEGAQGPICVGADRDVVVVSNRAEVVEQILSGQGQPWLSGASAELAAQPGVFVHADAQDALLRSLAERAPLPADAALEGGLSAVSVRVGAGPHGGLRTELLAPGLLEEALRTVRQRMAEGAHEEPEVGLESPAEHPSLDLLNRISLAQSLVWAESGAYVAYPGGPRDLDALDAQMVPWEGIPALGLEPMDTACRVEVSLDAADGFSARAYCDEDGDGVYALFTVQPGRPAEAVSGPEVR